MLSNMVIKKLLMGNKKVPAGCYVLNIPFIIIKRKNPNYIPQIHLSSNILRSSPDYVYITLCLTNNCLKMCINCLVLFVINFIDSVVSNISVTNMSQQRTYHNYKELRGFKVLILKYVKLQRDTQPLIRILCH